jgi:hypothetical protein
MALNKAALKASLAAAFSDELPQISGQQAEAIDRIAGKFADAVDDYVRGGIVPAGIQVQVDPATGIGATVSTGSLE